MNTPVVPLSRVADPAAPISGRPGRLRAANVRAAVIAGLFAATFAFITGCASTPPPSAAIRAPEGRQTLHAGDVIKISFPRAATLDTTQQIRRDGKINLYLIGEVQAADMSPEDLEKALMDKYATQLVSKEVRVTVVSSAFTVYVAGAVVRPGKITPDHEVTAFEAVMEAGGFDREKANLKAVAVIRREGNETKNYKINLKAVIDGKESEPFYLKANDVVYVPERLSIF